MRNLNAKTVREAAQGKWLEILSAIVPGISPSCKKVGKRSPCPVHGGVDGFRMLKKNGDGAFKGAGGCNTCGFKGDGFALLMWYRQSYNGRYVFADAVEEVGEYLNIKDRKDERKAAHDNQQEAAHIQRLREKQAQDQKENDVRIRYILKKIWSETLALSAVQAEPARLYLSSRKILNWDAPGYAATLRFHPKLRSYNEDGVCEGEFPAIVALIRDAAGVPVTLHRIFLTPKGEKAPVESVKKMCPIPSNRSVTGGAIQLGKPGEILHVAEGIETALAISMAMGVSVWPLVNTGLMETFVPPAGVKGIVIWEDKDVSGGGEKAAKALQARAWALGLKCARHTPTLTVPEGGKSVDWNDVLIQLGRFGFPQSKRHAA